MIQFVPETGSTNSDLADRLKAGDYLAEGDWLVADRQLGGRGRHGRDWSDGLGNFMGSSVVRVMPGDPPAHTLALVAGLALYEAVVPHLAPGAKACLKWPNDLMVGEAKLAGILLERVIDTIIVGIGVNLCSAPRLPDRKTIALADCGDEPARDQFAQALASSFDTELHRWRSYGLGPVITRWQASAHEIGIALEVLEYDGIRLTGTFAGLARDGALQLRLADGSMRAIHAGEVLLAGGQT